MADEPRKIKAILGTNQPFQVDYKLLIKSRELEHTIDLLHKRVQKLESAANKTKVIPKEIVKAGQESKQKLVKDMQANQMITKEVVKEAIKEFKGAEAAIESAKSGGVKA